jgi:diacylglycerol kinase
MKPADRIPAPPQGARPAPDGTPPTPQGMTPPPEGIPPTPEGVPPTPTPQTPVPPRRHGLAASFRFAFAGIGYLFRTQRNARIHAVLGAIALLVAWWLRVTSVEWAMLVMTIAGVLILEGLNTALEAVVDLASPDIDPLAKVAKDVAAGMVLIAAIGSVGVGLFILGPPLWAKIAHL